MGSNLSWAVWWKHFKIVTWKNYLSKIRSRVTTIFEVVIPFIIMILMVWIKHSQPRKEQPTVHYADSKYDLAQFASYDSTGSFSVVDVGTFSRHYDGSHMTLLPEILRRTGRRIAFVDDGADATDVMEFMKRAFSMLDNNITDLFHDVHFKSRSDFENYVHAKTYGIDKSSQTIHCAIVAMNTGADMELSIRMNTTGIGAYRADMPVIDPDFNPSVNDFLKGYDGSSAYNWLDGSANSFSTKATYPQGGFIDFQQLLFTYTLVKQNHLVDPTINAAPPSKEFLAWRHSLFTEVYMNPAVTDKNIVQEYQQKQLASLGLVLPLAANVSLPAPYNTTNIEEALDYASKLSPQQLTIANAEASLAVSAALAEAAAMLVPIKFSEVPFPHRAYLEDDFLDNAGQFLSFLILIGYFYPLSRMIKAMMDEKADRIREGAKTMGLMESTMTASWYLIYGVLFLVGSILVTIPMSFIWPETSILVLFILMFLFSISVLSYALFIQSFFSAPKLAAVFGSVLFTIMYFPYSSSGAGQTTSFITQLIICIFPPSCMCQGIYIINAFQDANIPITGLDGMWRTSGNFALGDAYYMLIVDIFLYLILAFYFDTVIPKQWGVALKWNFFLTPSYWKSGGSRLSDDQVSQKLRQMVSDSKKLDSRLFEGEYFEPSTSVKDPAVELRGLRRTFGSGKNMFTAVEGSWLRLYEGEILALLGHNGAGKTTTISMLTGMLPITEGDGLLYGLSVANGDLDQARKMIGFCPQHDILFPHLTVREHLQFFCAVKDVPAEYQEAEIDEQLRLVGLKEREWQQAVALSGGQKRRLSVAIALLGGSKIVFLDEPSTGVDPYMRHQLWDALKEARKGRVIILTTHFMEEADYLGDKVAIMANGKIQCAGTSLFLKSKYGAGHTLSVNKVDPNPSTNERIVDFVRSKVPEADVTSQVAAEVQFRLPFGASGIADIIEKFEAPDHEKFGVRSFALGVTTLEEVFLKAGAHGSHGDVTAITNGEEKQTPGLLNRSKNIQGSVEGGNAAPYSNQNGLDFDITTNKTALFFKHVKALVFKRAHTAKRDIRGWICQVGLPVLFVWLALTVLAVSFTQTTPMGLNPGDVLEGWYTPANILYTFDDSLTAATSCFAATTGNTALLSSGWNSTFVDVKGQKLNDTSLTPSGTVDGTTLSLSHYLLDAEWRDTTQIIDRYIALNVKSCPNYATYTPLQVDVMYNSTARDALPMALSETFNSLLKSLNSQANSDPSKTAPSFRLVVESLPITSDVASFSDIFTSIFLAMGFSFIPAFWGLYVVREREVKAKHMQYVSGVSILAYWTSTLIWDVVFFLIPMACSLILMAIYGVNSLVSEGNLGYTVLIMLLYGVCVACMTYCIQFIFSSHITAQNILSLIYIITGSLLLMGSFILQSLSSTKNLYNNFLVYVFYIFPNFAFAKGITNLILRSQPILWGGETPSGMDHRIAGTAICYMIGFSFVYFGLTILIEYAISTPIIYSWLTTKKERVHQDLIKDKPDEDLDDDVAAERQRLRDAIAANPARGTGDVVQILGLQKCYPTKPPRPAVKSVYFGIPAGQCFGYLGVNGAGKTTTLRMLTGDEVPTYGSALLGGKDILSQQQEVRQMIGYCPQFDALISEMTARETLWMYARIKGYPENKIAGAVDYLIDMLSLQEYADRPCGSYSGGNKRKLSVGIALIGDPTIVFLDEPTSGVDPASRRFMWNLISTTMAGRSVILTTHSMEECEALCQNIAIMVAGQLKCIGPASHLKSKFGNAYQVELNLFTPAATNETEETSTLRLYNWFAHNFPGSSLIERHGIHLVLRIPKELTQLAPIFRAIEADKAALKIRDYAVSETSLEQIFIAFAAQDENLHPNASDENDTFHSAPKEVTVFEIEIDTATNTNLISGLKNIVASSKRTTTPTTLPVVPVKEEVESVLSSPLSMKQTSTDENPIHGVPTSSSPGRSKAIGSSIEIESSIFHPVSSPYAVPPSSSVRDTNNGSSI